MITNENFHEKIHEVRERLFDAEILLIHMSDPSTLQPILQSDDPGVVLGALLREAKEHVSKSAGEMTYILDPIDCNRMDK